MKKIIIIFPYILLILAIGIISYQQEMLKAKDILLSKYTNEDNTLLSMMIENEDGEYKESTNNEWPNKGYILNKDRSGCENGGTLEYNDNNVYVKAASSDRCYVYFAIDNATNRCLLNYEESLACDLIKNKDNSLIYHDGKDDYENMPNSNLEAGDLSYRFVGVNPNNYVCFGGECSNNSNDSGYKYLYRIIGLFKNDKGKYEAKIIKADATTKEDIGEGTYPDSAYRGEYKSSYSEHQSYYKGKNWDNIAIYAWNDTTGTSSSNNHDNMWASSNLNVKNLNGIYYNAIDLKYRNMVAEHIWEVGAIWNTGNAKSVYDYELGDNKLTSLSNNCYTQGNITDKRLCDQPNDLTYSGDNAHVGLMYVSDYMYGTLPEYWTTTSYNYQDDDVKNNDWLYLGLLEWTISRNSDTGNGARNVRFTGSSSGGNYVANGLATRPVVYLAYNIKTTGGSGAETDPYKLSL